MAGYQTKTLTDRHLLLGLLDKDSTSDKAKMISDTAKSKFAKTNSVIDNSSQKLNRGVRLGATT